MTSIGPVELRIFKNNPSEGLALVQVSYEISQTLDDMASGRSYREPVQLVSVGRRVGEPGLEHVIPGEPLWDDIVDFTEYAGFTRGPEKTIPLDSLEQGITSPLQRDAIRARVTLTPLPPVAPTRESNTVNVNQQPVNEP